MRDQVGACAAQRCPFLARVMQLLHELHLPFNNCQPAQPFPPRKHARTQCSRGEPLIAISSRERLRRRQHNTTTSISTSPPATRDYLHPGTGLCLHNPIPPRQSARLTREVVHWLRPATTRVRTATHRPCCLICRSCFSYHHHSAPLPTTPPASARPANDIFTHQHHHHPRAVQACVLCFWSVVPLSVAHSHYPTPEVPSAPSTR